MRAENLEDLRRFNEEWDNAHSTDDSKPPIDPGTNGVIQDNGAPGLAEQIAKNSMTINRGTYQPASIPTTGNECSQCGTLHPPLRPGEDCPVAAEKNKTVTTTTSAEPTDTPKAPVQSPPQPQPESLTEGTTKSPEFKPSPAPTSPPPTPTPIPVQQTNVKAEPEPKPLVAENNIPTEIHVNKYLASWADIIMAHCKTHNIVNVKRLMRHLTVEVTDFLEHNKGR